MKPGLAGAEADELAPKLDRFVRNEPNFAKAIIQRADRENPYWPSYSLAQKLKMPPLVLSKITASFFVQTVGGMRVNLGLNLKFEARKQKVLGYSRKSKTGWEFSPAAVQLIAEYIAAFPDFFQAIKNNPQGSELSETDIFPDPAYASQRIKEMGAWIKNTDRSNFEKVPLEAEQLDSNAVHSIEQAVDALFAEAPQPVIRIMNEVPRNALIRPQDVEQRLGNQQFSLGDRVVYVQDSGKVPIGLKGTVVGISNIGSTPMLDVIFDQTFMGGSSLSERCSPFRGGVVPANTVLNTSYPQLLAASKARRHQAAQVSQASSSRAGGKYVGANGQSYREAPAPTPLHGSYTGALNGQASSHRGRGRGGYLQPNANGGPQLQSANLVYRPAPNGHNQQPFHANARGGAGQGPRGGRGGGALYNPQAGYNAVPPPASLNHDRGRGRGRGRGPRGGRGGPPRGRGGAVQPQTA
jgi:5'-3' exoribonuclease 1